MSNTQKRFGLALGSAALALAVIATPMAVSAEPVFGPLTRPNEISGPTGNEVYVVGAPGQYLGIGPVDGQPVFGPLTRPNEVNAGPIGEAAFQALEQAPVKRVPGQYLGIGPVGGQPYIGPLTRPNEVN